MSQNRIRVFAQISKLDGVSQEELDRHRDTWAKVFMALPIAQKNVLKLEIQIPARDELGILRELGFSDTNPEYNATDIVETETYEQIEEIVKDEMYRATVEPLAARLLDLSAMKVTPVTVYTFETGSALPALNHNRVRVVIEVHKLDDATTEEFVAARQKWATHLLELPIAKTNIYKLELMQPIEGVKIGNCQASSCGWTIVEAESYEKIAEVFQHDSYLNLVDPVSSNAVNHSKIRMMPFVVTTCIDK